MGWEVQLQLQSPVEGLVFFIITKASIFLYYNDLCA